MTTKLTKTWTKGSDFMDDSPRYTFEGRDPGNTYERFRVVVFRERVLPYSGTASLPSDKKVPRYFVYVFDNARECDFSNNPKHGFKSAREAKIQAEHDFKVMLEHPDTINFRGA